MSPATEQQPPSGPRAGEQVLDLPGAIIEIAHTLDSTVDACLRLERTLALLKTVLRCDRCSLLYERASDGGRQLMSVPIVPSPEVAPLETRLLTLLRAVEENQPLPPDAGGQALALPLVGLDQVRGILAVERHTAPFTADEMRLFSAVTAQLGAYVTLLRLDGESTALDRFKRDMAALAVHDIKNPLAAVIGMVDFLSLELHDVPEHVRACLTDIRTACNRIHRVTANLLDMARLQSRQLPMNLVTVDVPALLDALAKQRRAQAGFRNVQLLTRPSGEARVRADEDLFARVVDNLLDNALRYAPPHGRIELETRRIGDRVQVRVGNNGPPIPSPFRETLFDRRERSPDPARVNMGLGLYFARIAMEAQGGRIWAEQTPELPAVFALELPAAPTSSAGTRS